MDCSKRNVSVHFVVVFKEYEFYVKFMVVVPMDTGQLRTRFWY